MSLGSEARVNPVEGGEPPHGGPPSAAKLPPNVLEKWNVAKEALDEFERSMSGQISSRNLSIGLIEYWKKVRETIQNFDNILSRDTELVLSVLSGTLAVTGVLFLQQLRPVASGVSLAVVLAAIAAMLHSSIYHSLLAGSVETAGRIEDLIFPDPSDEQLRLSRYLGSKVSAERQRNVFVASYTLLAILGAVLAVIYWVI